MPIIVYAPKVNHLFGKKIQELQKKLISTGLLSIKFCHLKHEKTGSIVQPQQEVILPSYPNSTLVVFLDFSSFRQLGNMTSQLMFTASWLSHSRAEKNQGTPLGPGYPNRFRTKFFVHFVQMSCKAWWPTRLVVGIVTYSSNASIYM